MSAIKLAPYFHSAALLGTNISESKVHEILLQPEQYKRIYLSLDNDATYDAVRKQLKLHNRLKNLLVLGLPKDVKNMTDKELKEYLERVS